MKKRIVWVAVSGLMALSLVMAACGPAAVEEKEETGEKVILAGGEEEEKKVEEKEEVVEEEVVEDTGPKYGGTLVLSATRDETAFDTKDSVGGGMSLDLNSQRLWDGDWAKGNAGGYGTGETDWGSSYDVRAHKRGYAAEDITFNVDGDQGSIVYTIRQGIHWAAAPNSEANRLVGGQELTADDVVFSIKRVTTDPTANIYRSNPNLRNVDVSKTGPWEVTVKVPASVLLEAGKRFGDSMFPLPQKVIEELGDIRDWHNAVGTGPFILTDYIPGSAALLTRNPGYWMKDPVGPGQGNQLPYLDAVRWLIIPDISTRLAALRTGKIDRMYGINWEDAALMDKTTPELLKAETGQSAISPVYMRTDKAPFSDIRVRRAMMMGIDFETVSAGMYNSLGNIITWPYNAPAPHAYSGLYLGLDDPDMPESIKELYTYNPDKAKQLLSEAGYPDGFRAELVLTATNVDYYSIYKDMWSKVGIELVLDVKESGAFASINQDRAYESLITSATGPPSIWPMLIVMTGEGWQNQSYLDDPVINDAAAEIGKLAITDPVEAMGLTRELMKHVLDQAYVIPNPSFPSFLYWWPWLKNYSGERSIGYFWVESWPQWVWLDQDMKASMGY